MNEYMFMSTKNINQIDLIALKVSLQNKDKFFLQPVGCKKNLSLRINK